MKTCKELLSDLYEAVPQPPQGETLQFEGVSSLDVYNISVPFKEGDKTIIAGRVEPRCDELDSRTMFFECASKGTWVLYSEAPVLFLQDPFYARIGNEHVVGGVHLIKDAEGALLHWETHFYRGVSLKQLEWFAKGPQDMKDIRLVELPGGKIGVFTRPHGLPDARAKIGYVEIDGLNQLSPAVIAGAKLFDGLFAYDEWGGPNQVQRLANGLLGIVGHISCKTDGGILHYYPMVFCYNPATGWRSDIRIIGTRAYFPKGPAKEPRLTDVVFTAGLVRGEGRRAMLYAGVSDAQAARVEIPDPFEGFEG